jgi:hypothetical protein
MMFKGHNATSTTGSPAQWRPCGRVSFGPESCPGALNLTINTAGASRIGSVDYLRRKA